MTLARPHEPLIPRTIAAQLTWWLPAIACALVAIGAPQRSTSMRLSVAIAVLAACGWIGAWPCVLTGDALEGVRRAVLVTSVAIEAFVVRATFRASSYGFDAIDDLVCALAAAAAMTTLPSIVGLGGVATEAKRSTAIASMRWVSVWAFVAQAPIALLELVRHARGQSIWPNALVLGPLVAFLASLAALSLAHLSRHLELEAHERLTFAWISIATAWCAATFGAAFFGASPNLGATFALSIAIGVVGTHLVGDIVRASWRALRVGVVIVVVIVVARALRDAKEISLVVVALIAAAPSLALWLVSQIGAGREHHLLRDISTRARHALGLADTHDAHRGLLDALRRLAADERPLDTTPPPRLVLIDSAQEIVLDRAGEPMPPRALSAPDALIDLLRTEPLGVVRVEVLRAIEVIAPRVRPALAWLEGVNAASAVAIVADGELLGAMVCGDGGARPHVSLARARALSSIASDAAGRMAIEAAAARAVARAHRAQMQAAKAIDDELRAEAALAAMVGRRGIDLDASTRAARLRAYAPASRQLHDAIDVAAREGVDVVLEHPATIDPATWIALWFQRSRAPGGFETIDAAALATLDDATLASHVEARVTAARRGAVAVTSAHRLGERARIRLEYELDRVDRVDRGERPRLLFATPRSASVDPPQVKDRRPAARLAIPPLRARLDDLRGVALDHLARLGESIDGAPIGISDAAVATLLEHDWPGDDDELAVVLTRAAIARLARTDGADRRRVEPVDLALSTAKIAAPMRTSP